MEKKIEKKETKKKNKCEDLHHILIIAFCLFFMITILVIEIKDWTHDYSYQSDSSKDESKLDAINWSGDLNDLRYCHIFIWNTKPDGNMQDITFAWLKDCEMVKQECEFEQNQDDCYFWVERNKVYDYASGRWTQTFDGRCACHLNRNYINSKLDR